MFWLYLLLGRAKEISEVLGNELERLILFSRMQSEQMSSCYGKADTASQGSPGTAYGNGWKAAQQGLGQLLVLCAFLQDAEMVVEFLVPRSHKC